MRRGPLTAVLAAALLLAGCGAGDDAADGETLQDFLGGGVDTDDPEAMQAQFEDEQRRVEEHVAECMAEQGFDYAPVDPSDRMTSHPSQDMDEEAFREEYGYGLTTIEPEVDAEPLEDPNQERLREMDEAEREAYQRALQGEMPEPDPDADPGEPVEFEIGGCRGEAQDEIRGDQQRIQQELGDELQALYEQVQSDPRIAEAEQEWAACMQSAGHDFDDPQEPFEYLMEEQQELRGGPAQEPELDPETIEQLESGELSPDDIEMPEPPEPDPDALAELQAEELELAAVDHECRTEHFGEDQALFQEVMEEYERDFVEEHRDTLEELQ